MKSYTNDLLKAKDELKKAQIQGAEEVVDLERKVSRQVKEITSLEQSLLSKDMQIEQAKKK